MQKTKLSFAVFNFFTCGVSCVRQYDDTVKVVYRINIPRDAEGAELLKRKERRYKTYFADANIQKMKHINTTLNIEKSKSLLQIYLTKLYSQNSVLLLNGHVPRHTTINEVKRGT